MTVYVMALMLIGTLAIGEALLISPMEKERRLLPDGRSSRFPRTLRADRPALYFLVLAVDCIAAASFLMWPLTVFGDEAALVITVTLVPMMSIGPATWWLIGLLDANAEAVGGGEHGK